MAGVVSVGSTRELISVHKLMGDYVHMFVAIMRAANPEGLAQPEAAAPPAGDDDAPSAPSLWAAN